MLSRRRSGFTLIELLVVIIVISILLSISVVGYTVQQKRSRDAERKADVSALRASLEKFYDQNGEYPDADSNYFADCASTDQATKNYFLTTFTNISPEVLVSPSAGSNVVSSICRNGASGSSNSPAAGDMFYVYDTQSAPTGCQLTSVTGGRRAGTSSDFYILMYYSEADSVVKYYRSAHGALKFDPSGSCKFEN